MSFDENMNNDENHTAISRAIEQLKETGISFENFRKYADKVDNNVNVILAQIENNRAQYNEQYNKYREQMKTDRFKSMRADNIVPLDVFRNVVNLNKILKDTIAWYEMKSSMYEIMYKKLLSTMDEANAMSIKKEALQEMREMEKERNKVITDAITHKFKLFDERFDSMIRSMMDSQKAERREMISAFQQIINQVSISQKQPASAIPDDDENDDYFSQSYNKKSNQPKYNPSLESNETVDEHEDSNGFNSDSSGFHYENDEAPSESSHSDGSGDKKSVKRHVEKTDKSISDIEQKFKNFNEESGE